MRHNVRCRSCADSLARVPVAQSDMDSPNDNAVRSAAPKPCRSKRGLPNKRMQLTKLRAAPVLRAEVPPCAPAGEMDGGTASQLIRSVSPTIW
jgi:hypothetical protein